MKTREQAVAEKGAWHFKEDGNTRFYLDDDEVSCETFNDFFNAHDVGWGEWTDEQGTNHVVIYTDDAN